MTRSGVRSLIEKHGILPTPQRVEIARVRAASARTRPGAAVAGMPRSTFLCSVFRHCMWAAG